MSVLRRALVAVPGLALVAAGAVAIPSPSLAADEPAPTTVALPPVPDGWDVMAVDLDGSEVIASVRTADGAPPPASTRVLRAPSDGSGDWTVVTDPSGTPALGDALVPPAQVAAGVIGYYVGSAPSPRPDVACSSYRLLRAATAIEVPACGSGIELGWGGRVVSSRDADGVWQARRTDDGSLLPGRPLVEPSNQPAPIVDGTTSWTAGAGAVLRGVDLVTGATVQRALPAVCAGASAVRQAADGQVLVGCAGGEAVLVDTTRSVAPRLVPSIAELGAVGVRLRASTGLLDVHDLGVAHRTWSLPATGVGDLFSGASGTSGPDIAGGPRAVLTTSARQVVVATVPVSAPVTTTEDVTAPTVALDRRPAPVSRRASGVATWEWTGSDVPYSGALAYEWQTATPAPGAAVVWSASSGPEAFTGFASVSLSGDDRSRACLRVRSLDWAGNASPWQGSCTELDGTAPVVRWSDPLPRVLPRRGPLFLDVRYAATDVHRIGGFDVTRRITPAGAREPAAWESPAAWQRTTATRVSQRLEPGSEACFRVRARDEVGNLSPTSAARCTTVPFDDREVAVTGSSRRTTGGRVGDTLTVLGTTAVLRTGTVTGSQVLLTARGSTPFCFRVALDGRMLPGSRCVASSSDGYRQVRVSLGRTVTGRLRIEPLGSRSILLDSVAVLR